jgi:UDP-glucose 4-epimerase
MNHAKERNMPTSLITGGAGFIGSHIVDALLKQGDSVRVLDNLSTGTLENLSKSMDKIEFIQGDIRKSEDLKKALKGVNNVYHQAAFVSVPSSLEEPHTCLNINVQGTLNLLEFAKLANVKRVIIASSAAVYGDNPDYPLTETGKINPLSPYASSKYINEIFTEMYSNQLGLEVVALRYFNVYGPRQNPESDYAAVIPVFINQLINKERPVIYGDGNQSRDFVFVADVAHANILAGNVNYVPSRVINICSGLEISLLDLVDSLSIIFNQKIDPIFTDPRAGDIFRSVGDPSLAREILGFYPQTAISNGLQTTVDWMLRA